MKTEIFETLGAALKPQVNPTKIGNVEAIQALEGQKATIFKYSEFGFPQSIQCNIGKVYTKNYAQYDNMVHIEYKPKGKRTWYVMRMYNYTSFTIYAGHVDLNADMFVKESKSSATGLTIRESRVCFSKDYIYTALNSTDQKPIYLQIK